jgi:hypothetical protein
MASADKQIHPMPGQCVALCGAARNHETPYKGFIDGLRNSERKWQGFIDFLTFEIIYPGKPSPRCHQ